MNVGDYVRLKNDKGYACIGKIYNINDYREPDMKYCIDVQSSDFIFVSEKEIVKSSPQIIVLIEKNDFVNGYKVLTTMYNEEINIPTIIKCLNGVYIEENEIETIVTHEQFEAMEYKVGD